MKAAIRFIIIAGLLGGFAYTLYFLFQKNQKPEIQYRTEQASVQDIVKQTVATGSVVPRKEILIKPVVSGIIEHLYVEPGEYVSRGEPLAKIKIIPNMVNLNNAENRVKRAKIELENTRIDFSRQQKLFNQKVISKSEFQPFELGLKNAKLELSAAKENLQIIREGASKNSTSTTNTIVRSTISGMILDVPVKEGNQVIEANTFNEGTTVASIANMEDLIFEGNLDESEVGKVSEGMDLILTIGALQDQKYKAKLEYISPKGTTVDGAIQFVIKAALEQGKQQSKDHFIRAGYSANAAIVLDKRDKVLTVEEKLVEYEKDLSYVYVQVDSQRFEKRPIKLGLSDGIKAEVLSGITDKDQLRSKKIQIAK